jgi:hypothetical protein
VATTVCAPFDVLKSRVRTLGVYILSGLDCAQIMNASGKANVRRSNLAPSVF